MGQAESIAFVGTVSRVTTLADGGLRVTFDLPEDAIVAVAWLMESKRVGVALAIECTPDESEPHLQ